MIFGKQTLARGAFLAVFGLASMGLGTGVIGGWAGNTSSYGNTSRNIVTEFYTKTLPELGWKSLDATHYHREGERLVIDFFGTDGALNVRFTLVPE